MHKVWTGGVLVGLVLAAGVLRAGDAEKPRLAVLMMDDYGSGLKADEVVSLTDLLTAEMAKGDRYLLMPRDEVRKRLGKRKGKAEKLLGPPPDKALESSIYRVGKQCIVVARIYDVHTTIMETAAFRRGTCSPDALLEQVKAMASDLMQAEVDPAAPLTALHLFESRGSGLKAVEVLALTRMVESALVAKGGARLVPTEGARERLADLAEGAQKGNSEVRYVVNGVIGRLGKLCLATIKVFDLSTSTMIMALPERSPCDPDSMIDVALKLSQDLADEMGKLKTPATGKKQAPSAPTSPIDLPPRRASPASGR